MSLSMKNVAVLAMKQTAKGTPATPVPGTHAILCKGAVPVPIKGTFVERNLLMNAKGNHGSVFGGEYRTLELEVELAGAGTAGTAPKYGPLLEGCAMSETLSAGVSAVYQPVKDEGKYMTLRMFLEGVRFDLTDALGTVAFALNAAQIPVMKFSYTGKYVPATDAGAPTGLVYTGQIKPLLVGGANTATFTLGGLSLATEQFGLDLANQVQWKNFINASGARNDDRKPTANAVFEMTDVATKNWGESVRTGELFALAITHGLTAGNIVQIACPRLEFAADPTVSESNGAAMLNASFAVKPDTGNDELVLTIR